MGGGTGRRGLPGQEPLQLLPVFRRKDAALLRQVGLVFPQLVDRLLPELEKELNGDRIPRCMEAESSPVSSSTSESAA
ncbi:MAG: hypothetical protein ACLRNQ_01610 [Flavonifractor plautii]